MKSKVIIILIGLFTASIILYVFPIGKLVFSDDSVTKSLLKEEYYVKISSDDYDFNVFRDYMESKGWIENEKMRMGGLHVFEKEDETKNILNTQIKTIIVNGELNLKSLFREGMD